MPIPSEVALGSAQLRRAPSPPGPGCCCAAGAQPFSAGSHAAASEPAPSGSARGLPTGPSCLSHLWPKCWDGPQAAPAQWLGAAPGETSLSADPPGPGHLDTPAIVGPGRGCREGLSQAARRRGRFHRALTVTLQTHISRKETSAVISPSRDSARWVWTVHGVQEPPSQDAPQLTADTSLQPEPHSDVFSLF